MTELTISSHQQVSDLLTLSSNKDSIFKLEALTGMGFNGVLGPEANPHEANAIKLLLSRTTRLTDLHWISGTSLAELTLEVGSLAALQVVEIIEANHKKSTVISFTTLSQ